MTVSLAIYAFSSSMAPASATLLSTSLQSLSRNNWANFQSKGPPRLALASLPSGVFATSVTNQSRLSGSCNGGCPWSSCKRTCLSTYCLLISVAVRNTLPGPYDDANDGGQTILG